MDKQDFFDGTVFDAWRWFGAHIKEQSTIFRVFAPNAAKITLTGAFNDWKENELTQDGRSGFWEVSLPNAHAGQYYKYRITSHSGMVVEHCDPYGFAMELRPGCCSVITDPMWGKASGEAAISSIPAAQASIWSQSATSRISRILFCSPAQRGNPAEH
ncbi:MAG TPA: hypothetical protein H9845_07310 [Candidatus Agathobaculum pullicola]|nr:hypothetical protein [Candidatus Agathobaculum pullicola]